MANNLPAQQQQRINTVRALLDKAKPQIALALPRHLNADRLLRVAMTAIMRTPKLLDCDQQSLLGAIMETAQLGLEPDGILGHAYMVPFNRQVTLIVGYKGLIDLARRSGAVVSIQAHVVYEGDEFEYSYGLQDCLVHRPTLQGRGRPIAVYAAAVLKDGGHAFEVMSVEEVNIIRDGSLGYQAAKKYKKESPWDTNWDEMARKTAVRRLAKYLPISVEFQRASAHGEAWEAGIHPDMDIIEAEQEIPAITAEDEDDIKTMVVQLAEACPPSASTPPDLDDLLAYIERGAAVNNVIRSEYLRAALEKTGAFYRAYLGEKPKQQTKNAEVLEPEDKAGQGGLPLKGGKK